MVMMTMIARVADGLPLAATMQEDEQVRCTLLSAINLLPRGFCDLFEFMCSLVQIMTAPYVVE